MVSKINYDQSSLPVKHVVLEQPKGTWDLTLTKNAKGNRIRIASKNGDVVNVATAEVPAFIEALNIVLKQGKKISQRWLIS